MYWRTRSRYEDIDRRARDYFDSRDGFFVMKGEASDQWILDTYHGLWRIEETFKVTKSGLETRPVFVWTENRIRAHFLICFTALTILRLLQFRMGWRHSDAKIRDALLNASGTFIGQNVYAFDYSSPVLREIGDLLGIDFSRRYMTLGDIKKLLAAVKKVY